VAVGHGVTVPVGARGWRSHAWWAALILAVVDATVWASLLFAHVHVSMRAAVCPPPGASLPAAGWVAAAVGSAVASSAAIALVQRLSLAPSRRARVRVTLLVLTALLTLVAGAVCLVAGHHSLAPKADAWSATVAVLLADQVFHAIVLAVLALYLVARVWGRRLLPDSRASLDNVALLWHASVAQAVAGALAVQWLPGLMR